MYTILNRAGKDLFLWHIYSFVLFLSYWRCCRRYIFAISRFRKYCSLCRKNAWKRDMPSYLWAKSPFWQFLRRPAWSLSTGYPLKYWSASAGSRIFPECTVHPSAPGSAYFYSGDAVYLYDYDPYAGSQCTFFLLPDACDFFDYLLPYLFLYIALFSSVCRSSGISS